MAIACANGRLRISSPCQQSSFPSSTTGETFAICSSRKPPLLPKQFRKHQSPIAKILLLLQTLPLTCRTPALPFEVVLVGHQHPPARRPCRQPSTIPCHRQNPPYQNVQLNRQQPQIDLRRRANQH